jgi:hypothetical protein
VVSQSIHLTHITTCSSEHSFNYLTESVDTAVESITGATVVSIETDVESVFPVSVVDSFEPHALIEIIATNARKYAYFLITPQIYEKLLK